MGRRHETGTPRASAHASRLLHVDWPIGVPLSSDDALAMHEHVVSLRDVQGIAYSSGYRKVAIANHASRTN